MMLMVLVHANGVADWAVCSCWGVLGIVGARVELLLLHQIMIPVKLLPVGVHGERRSRSKRGAKSDEFEQRCYRTER